MSRHINNDFTIIVAGQAGQGIESVANVLAHVVKKHGYHVCVTKDVMSRVRGGMNSVAIRVANERRDGYREKIDLFVALDPGGYKHCEKRFTEDTIFMGVEDPTGVERDIVAINFIQLAHEVGNRIYANTIAAGAILGVMGAEREKAEDYLRTFFARKGPEIVDANIEALQKGFTIGSHTAYTEDITCTFTPQDDVTNYVFLSGAEAVGFGALSAGCNFISSYPMSPATGVLTFLAQNGKECGVLVEQATDEIGAINMTLGGWYAGARGIVTTSGGGYDLMTESVSLAAITETPIVVHIAQRPGPATGLPTRTGQEDLQLALYGGHGEFARAIFAPGSPEECYTMTAQAFDIADTYQVPAFILTDQLTMDSLYCAPREALVDKDFENHIEETHEMYKRYELTEDGLSPRGIPGYGKGLVHADSDEHDEEGRITEDMDFMRPQMVEKRLTKRKQLLVDAALMPELSGVKAPKILIISWGSNKSVVAEAVEKCKKRGVGVAHFAQVFPLNADVKKLLAKVEKIVVVESNYEGQFAHLLERETGEKVTTKMTKNNGEPFSVEELVEKFNTL